MLLAAALCFLVCAFTCLYLGTRWNRRHGRPRWPGEDAETARVRGLPRQVRRRADRAIRRGEAVDDPGLAVTVCQRARSRRRAVENPWTKAAQSVNMLMVGCVLGGQAAMGTLPPVTAGLAALCLALAVFFQLHRPWELRRTAVAVELNLPRAQRAGEEAAG
jgi:hypothetical protein